MRLPRINYRRWGIRALYLVAVIWLIIGVLEGLYRFQIIDFYKTELTFLNEGEELDETEEKATILVMGDSFSADNEGWVSEVRKKFPGTRVINSAVPGTGVTQAHIMAPGRFERFQPHIFLYQVYVGNDLFDIRYPYDSEKIGFMRKTYWYFSSTLRSLSWLNYKSGQVLHSGEPVPVDTAKIARDFHPDYFSPREKKYFEIEPNIITNHVMLTEDRKADFKEWAGRLKKLLAYCQSGECEAFVIVLPHCAQVSEGYAQNMRAMGARLPSLKKLMATEYPFWAALRNEVQGIDNVTLLNPLARLRAREQNGEAMYFANDIHLNAAGQRVLGEWVMEEIGGD